MKKSLLIDCLRMCKAHLPKHPEWESYKHYSVIIQSNQIIEWGTNRTAAPLIGYTNHSKFHSENAAYFRARGLLERNKSFEVVNIRFNKQGDLKLSRPCICCVSFLKFLGCSIVYFSTELGFAKLSLK